MENEKTKNNGTLTWAKALTVGLIIGGSVGTGAYFIYTNFIQENVELIEYGKPVEKSVLNEVPLVIHETNPGVIDDERTFFLSDKGMELLKHRIETELNFGPEIYDLHSISIDDDNQIGDDANGNYYPGRDTINLSSKQFRAEGLAPLKKGDAEEVGIEEIKVELLFQVLFHEYGHFIANKYLNGYTGKNSITTMAGTKYASSWNKDFQTNFEKIMQYDADPKHKPMLPIVKGQAWQSMGSVYSASDIFQRINYGDKKFPEVKDKPWVPIWAGDTPFFDTKKEIKGIDTSKLSYLWSMDEIYTRKYEQVLYPSKMKSYTTKHNSISGGFHYYRDEYGIDTNNITPYAYDTSIYRDLGKMPHDYMADNPLAKTQELTELMNRHEGRNDDISVILFDKDGNFRVGGYTSDDSFQIEIGGKRINSTIDEIPFLEDNWTIKNMWISDPINPDNMVGKTINRVTKDADKKEVIAPITNARHGLDGTISTKRTLIHHNSEYHLVYNDNKGNVTVTIEKGAGI